MKVLTTAVALAFLASEAQAWNHVWYWCGRDRNTCFNKGKPYDGVYPTAKCGQKEGWDNYDKAHGKWYMTTDEMNDFTKSRDKQGIMSDDAVLSRVNLSIDFHARVLICCHDVCRVALSPSPAQVSQHLRTKHNVPAAERRLVTDLLKARIPPLQSPSKAPIRQDYLSPDPKLQLIHGFTYKFCIERTGSSQVMSRHITSSHEKQRPQLGVQQNAIYEPVFLQAWTKSPSGGRYWIVEYGGSTTRPVGGKEVYDHLEDVFERERGRQKGLSGGDLANGAGTTGSLQTITFTDLRPWLERTGWERTFGEIDRELLRNLTAAPSPTASHRGLILKESSNLSSDVYSDK
ncbi:Protein of unknown function DUF3505 [Fusarium oxysporum f. sp. vasinfectum]|nr:Protein of unknown function DUF3505 [Fusarium oxysporum f. sp. vasinfectum]